MIAIPDYCDTPDEVAKNPEAKKYIALCSNGNPIAYQFAWRFWCFTHCIDDLVDRDKQAPPEVIVKSFIQFVDTLVNNEFFQMHKASLYPFMVQACAGWLDGEVLAHSDCKEDRIRGEVIRSRDVEIYLHIAYITGGWDYMRSIKDLRTFDKHKD